MSSTTEEPLIEEVIRLGKLSLLYGRTNRITFHEDGKRPETDTDHAIMIGLIGCGLAERYYPSLDRGLIAQLAIVHDLIEAYAGDTQTLRISDEARADKLKREEAAADRIRNEFAEAFPIIPRLITIYEDGVVPEARFVKAIDKFTPKITHYTGRPKPYNPIRPLFPV